MEIGGQEIVYSVEPRFRKVDRVAGELSEPLVIAPPVFVEFPRPVFVFREITTRRSLNVRVISSHPPKVAGTRRARSTDRLESRTGQRADRLARPGERNDLRVQNHAAGSCRRGNAASGSVLDGNTQPAFNRQRIAYPHIEPQTLISPAQAKLVRADIENKAPRVGYFPGAGDAIPESLREIGSDVKILDGR